MRLDRVIIEKFLIQGRLPYENRRFFCQHLAPYIFLKQILKFPAEWILEIGIGEGFGTYFLSQISEKTIGLDLDSSCYRFLREYKNSLAKDNIEFINANGFKLPFKDNTISAVIGCQVIEHIPEEHLREFLEEIRRVILPSGILLLSTLNLTHNVKDDRNYMKFAPHHREFDYNSLRDLLTQVFASFDILGLNITLRHRFFQRLKKWGLFNIKPVSRFYDNINTSDFVVSKLDTRKSLDLIAVCYKAL